MRLNEDVAWKLEPEYHELSEDGFCPQCEDFYSDCFCEAFWIRLLVTERSRVKKSLEKSKGVKKLVAALRDIGRPTYGTEFITYELHEYESNYEIIFRYLQGKQVIANKALAEWEVEDE